MELILTVIVAMILVNSCTCIREETIHDSCQFLEGNAMQVKDMRKLTSSSTDGRTAPAGEEIHHVCSLGNYPCQGMFKSSKQSTEGGGS
jgi:hypothetical protein